MTKKEADELLKFVLGKQLTVRVNETHERNKVEIKFCHYAWSDKEKTKLKEAEYWRLEIPLED